MRGIGRRSILAFALANTLGMAAAPAFAQYHGCLYSFNVGGATADLKVCPQSDVLEVSKNSRVQRAMAALGISAGTVRFRGCPNGVFNVESDGTSGDGSEKYVVNYDSNYGPDILAPVVHELSHVVQMQNAGGISRLRTPTNSLVVELSADFMAGLIFNSALSEVNSQSFLLSLKLIGSYFEKSADAHGTPAQRTTAFLLGSTRKNPYDRLGVVESAKYFADNHLARVLAN